MGVFFREREDEVRMVGHAALACDEVKLKKVLVMHLEHVDPRIL